MFGKRMMLSTQGKQILDTFTEYLSLTRPQVLKLAFAKGFVSEDVHSSNISSDRGWEIPDVFNEDDLLLFKHLIINKLGREIDQQEATKELLKHIELGLRRFAQLYDERNSLDDLRMLILS